MIRRPQLRAYGSPRWRRAAYATAVVLFVGTAWAGFASLPAHRGPIEPLFFIVVAGVLAPATTIVNAAEYAGAARFVGVRVRPVDALRVAVMSTAANILPVPGAVLVRAAALRAAGTGSVPAARSVLAASTLWVAATGAILGMLVLASAERLALGALLIVGAAALVAVAHRMAGAQHRPDGIETTARLLAVESAATALGAARLWCCARGLGFEVGAGDAVVLASASVLAAAIGFAPGGLGVREALAGAIAPLVGVPAAVGASSSVVDRVLGYVGVALAATAFAIGGRRRSTPPPDAPRAARP